ncbi:unnamed protein product, partial [Darwinula stevensoni]
YASFLVKEVTDTFPQLLDHGLRVLLQLLTTWKNSSPGLNLKRSSERSGQQGSDHSMSVLYFLEGFALVMLCHVRLLPRKLAVGILKEVKHLALSLGMLSSEEWAIDVLDKKAQSVLEKCTFLLPASEKAAISSTGSTLDMQWLVDRTHIIWTGGSWESCQDGGGKIWTLPISVAYDAWSNVLILFLERDNLPLQCPSAMAHAWPIVHSRLMSLFPVIDPNPVTDNRASLLRSTSTIKKPINEKDAQLLLWKNYAIFSCRVVLPNTSSTFRCASPDLGLSSSPETGGGEKDSSLVILKQTCSTGSSSSSALSSSHPPSALYKLLLPLLRCESPPVRDVAVLALGTINPFTIKDMMDEMISYLREALDRKQENMRRKKRRDALRLHPCVLDKDNHCLHPVFVEYIDGARLYLESEPEKENPVREIKLYFCSFIYKLIQSFSLDLRRTLLGRDVRRNLFHLFSSWSGKLSLKSHSKDQQEYQLHDFEWGALQAMCAVLACGPCFDPRDLLEDGSLYPWLDRLLEFPDKKVQQLGRETLELLLEFNGDTGALLDSVVERCYTGSVLVADACFCAIASIFSNREYPCDHYTAIITLTLLNTGNPRVEISECAFHLLLLLDKRFFGAPNPFPFDDQPQQTNPPDPQGVATENNLLGKEDATDDPRVALEEYCFISRSDVGTYAPELEIDVALADVTEPASGGPGPATSCQDLFGALLRERHPIDRRNSPTDVVTSQMKRFILEQGSRRPKGPYLWDKILTACSQNHEQYHNDIGAVHP